MKRTVLSPFGLSACLRTFLVCVSVCVWSWKNAKAVGTEKKRKKDTHLIASIRTHPSPPANLETYWLGNILHVNTNFAIDHFVPKITWIIERQSYENTLSLVKSAWIWTIQRKFISHLSIGPKAARDKVNQIAHVRKSRGSLGTTNTADNRERASAFGSRERLFSGLIKIFQRIWSVNCKR